MATSIASVTTDTTNYTRIHLILMKGGTLLTKTLFLKRVKDLSPAGHELTVDEFLGKHRVQILSTSTGRNNEEKLYPLTGTTNLDEWDLPLYCFILKTVCDLLWINKMDMKFLKTMRNELSHLHDPSLTDEDFKSRLSMIEPIFTRSLQVINDPLFEGEITNLVQRYKTGALAVDEIVKIHHDSSRKHIELLSNQLKIMKNQVDILQNQNIHNTQLTTALSMLKKIDDKLPSGSDVDIPDVCVIIEVKNCTRDKEQELLDFLVKQFNETISKPECNLTKDFPNLAMHTISEAICTTLKEFLAKGRHVLKVEKKCISLTIKCNSLSSFVSLVSDCIDGSLLHQLKSLKDAVRRWDGCAGADLDPTISADGISSAILKIATNLDEKLLEEDQSAVLLLPEVCSSTMSVDSPSSLETFPLCSTGSILRLTIKPDTIECRKEIEESFIGSVTEGLEQFQNELRKDPDFQNLVIEAKILASDNGRTDFTVCERTPDKTAFLSPNKIVKSYKSKTWNMRKAMMEYERHEETYIWSKLTYALKVTKVALCYPITKQWKTFLLNWSSEELEDLSHFFQVVEDDSRGIQFNERTKEWNINTSCKLCQSIFSRILQQQKNKRSKKLVWKPNYIQGKFEGSKIVPTNDFPQTCSVCNLKQCIFEAEREGFELLRKDDFKIPALQRHSPIALDNISKFYWRIANMFMFHGVEKDTMIDTAPADTDPALIFKLLKNCELFNTVDLCTIDEVLAARNSLMHSPNHRISQKAGECMFDVFKDMISQFCCETCECGKQEIEKLRSLQLTSILTEQNDEMIKGAFEIQSKAVENDVLMGVFTVSVQVLQTILTNNLQAIGQGIQSLNDGLTERNRELEEENQRLRQNQRPEKEDKSDKGVAIGATGGATAGAALGSVLGPAGTVAGGIIGGLYGVIATLIRK